MSLQDKVKMEIHQKPNASPEPEEVQEMVRYAKNIIEEFRRAKHYKNILTSYFLFGNNRTIVIMHACLPFCCWANRVLK